MLQNVAWATFWAIISQRHLVALLRCNKKQESALKKN
jgi:hypothetical protein